MNANFWPGIESSPSVVQKTTKPRRGLIVSNMPTCSTAEGGSAFQRYHHGTFSKGSSLDMVMSCSLRLEESPQSSFFDSIFSRDEHSLRYQLQERCAA